MATKKTAKKAAKTAPAKVPLAKKASAKIPPAKKASAKTRSAKEASAKKTSAKRTPVTWGSRPGSKTAAKASELPAKISAAPPRKAVRGAPQRPPQAPAKSHLDLPANPTPEPHTKAIRAGSDYPVTKATATPKPAKAVSSAPETEDVVSANETGTPAIGTPADLVDTQLARYRSMRDFNVTAEPSGAEDLTVSKAVARPAPARTKPNSGLPFVIQKHAASHLHYDFRLGWSGVLKSWAVAKGPSYVVADRRLAVQVEDHPMEYGGFEGVIPKGQYGGGTVMVWDQGTWWPQPGHENVDAGLRTGSLKFEMHGTKMQGKWTLVRMHTTKPYGGDNGRWKGNDKPQWLLIKEHDEFERPATAAPVVDDAPRSALTGRTMDEIAQQSDHVWNSKETAGAGQAWYRQDPPSADAAPRPLAAPSLGAEGSSAAVTTAAATKEADTPGLRVVPRPRPAAVAGPTPRPRSRVTVKVEDALEDLPREPQPEFLSPQLAQEAEEPPEGHGWLHELKLDGYRMQARKSARGVQMLTRSGLDWTYRVPAIAEAVAELAVESVTLDGEVVVLAEDGNTNFADLQASFQSGEAHPLTFFCFDLLHLEGRNPRNLPLRDRKALLAEVMPREEDATVRFSEHMETDGRLMFEQACRLHAEGIISKRADEPYQVGRRSGWLKSKCLHEQEFVVGGFTLSSDGPDRIGSLLLGYYRDRKLIYAGRAGTGFTQKQRRELRAQLAPLQTKTSAYGQVPAEARRDALWVRPELVAQVRFATWTAEDLLRQAAFLGLREDKPAGEVVREDAAPSPKNHDRKIRQTIDTAKSQVDPPAKPAAEAEKRASSGATKPHTLPPVRLTHPKKILDPETALTKQQLADYYWAVAERMLPHIADRPLSLVRCPDGAGKPCFYQKHVNHMLPPGIGSVMVADKKGGAPEPYITLNTPEALAGLAQMGVLEVHPWGSGNGQLECPDRLIFDLDPDESLSWSAVTDAAREVRLRLKKIGLESFLKTTGGKGLHIVSPIAPELDFATVKDTAHRFVLAMERANPRLYLTKMTKAARTGKIYLDYLRNERGATAVAPFSPRARPGVTASVPLEWKELDATDRPRFAVSDFAAWGDRLRRDPWKRMATLSQHLDPALLRLL